MSGAVRARGHRRSWSGLGYWLGTADGEVRLEHQPGGRPLQKAAGLGPGTGSWGRRPRRLWTTERVRTRGTTSGSAIEVDKTPPDRPGGQRWPAQVRAEHLDRQRAALHLRRALLRGRDPGGPIPACSGRSTVCGWSRLGELWRPKYFTGGVRLCTGHRALPGVPGLARLRAPVEQLRSTSCGRPDWPRSVAPSGSTDRSAHAGARPIGSAHGALRFFSRPQRCSNGTSMTSHSASQTSRGGFVVGERLLGRPPA